MGADQHFDIRDQIASTLDWWREAGVDTLIDEDPRDWLAAAVASPAAPAPPAEAAVAALPDALAEFVPWRTGDAAIERQWGRTPLAPEGDPSAAIHVIVDSPDDDAAYLSGATGRLFDRMLAAIALDRTRLCITGLAWARPVSGSVPASDEAELATQALHFLSLARPKRVLLLGQATSRALLGTDGARPRGLLHGINHRGAELEMVATWHPRFLLERPAAKADTWRDLQLLIGGIDQ